MATEICIPVFLTSLALILSYISIGNIVDLQRTKCRHVFLSKTAGFCTKISQNLKPNFHNRISHCGCCTYNLNLGQFKLLQDMWLITACKKKLHKLYNVILCIARNLLETRENIKIESHPFYHIICDWFSWGSSKIENWGFWKTQFLSRPSWKFFWNLFRFLLLDSNENQSQIMW